MLSRLLLHEENYRPLSLRIVVWKFDSVPDFDVVHDVTEDFLSFPRYIFEGIDEGSLNSALDRAFSLYKNSKFCSLFFNLLPLITLNSSF